MKVLRFLAVLLLLGRIAPANDLSDDLTARRARVMERLGPNAMLVLKSAPVRNYSLDVDYEYRQDSNFYYLTGITQPGTTLVLMPGNTTRREILFISPRDPVQEHWTGHVITREDAIARTGIQTVLTSPQFEPFLQAMLTRQASGGVSAADAKAFFDALAANRAVVALALEPPTLNDPPGPAMAFANQLRNRFVGFQIADLTPILSDLRIVKTPYERTLLIRSGVVSSAAQMVGMQTANAGAYEYQVKAAIEAAQRSAGAESWAYPSIVGSGPNATILHYSGSDRQMQTGDLLLVDAGASVQYAATDVTRTYPVSGTFTAAQRDIYSIVLRAQEEAAKIVAPGVLSNQIHTRTVEIIKEGLLALGLITDARGEQYRMWYTHGATHYIGIDVHDVGDRNHPLQVGMAFTIEPGIYIRQTVLDELPRTPENLALIQRIQPAVTKYNNIGVRIEDSFLLEADGLKNLSASVPKTIEGIEQFLQASGARQQAPGTTRPAAGSRDRN
ncbi:MAG TPA: aminopeptidase P N-terminal domain-containing protein [Vicinamibacterales bacterium]|nr:aminopeptidase P N-terminal domain-containing protein [Vicinamibacterales bacterium]